MTAGSDKIFQLRLKLSGISPMIWRRFWLHSNSTLADLHYIIQILMDWSDEHLHCFYIKGKKYGISTLGGICFSDDPHQITLEDLKLAPKDKFTYEYNFHANWRHEIRVEKCLISQVNKSYPICTAGKRASPPEECESVWKFLELQQHYSEYTVLTRLAKIIKKNLNDDEPLDEFRGEIEWLNYWANISQFDRKNVNDSLKKYASNGEDFFLWRYS
jgi:hypothetical protein